MGESEAKRGFGSTMQAIVECFNESASSSVHVVAFLSGIPNWGLYPLSSSTDGGEDALLSPEIDAYKDMGEMAARAGIAIDLVVASASFAGLPTLRELISPTGGSIIYTDDLYKTELPQDIFNLLTSDAVYAGIIRVRISSAIQVAHAYGTWLPDHQYDNLFRIAKCDRHYTFAVDFEFSGSSEFRYTPDSKATTQVAFAYSELRDGRLQRFLRLGTVQQRIVKAPQEVPATTKHYCDRDHGSHCNPSSSPKLKL